MYQLAKIHRHRWKERLEINKVAKFERDLLKTNEDVQNLKNTVEGSIHPLRIPLFATFVISFCFPLLISAIFSLSKYL